jgi:Cu/Ag efflux protein CusF
MEGCLPALSLISRHQSVQNAESLSNFSCIPSADLDNKTMSLAYIKQWIGELSKMTGSFNIKKNKILIFSKAGKHLSHKFVFQNNNLECVSRYKYLGIWFNNSGSFNFEIF